jgi:3-dehydroquinate synthetase
MLTNGFLFSISMKVYIYLLRLKNSREAEIEAGMAEVAKIAKLRTLDILQHLQNRGRAHL